MTYQLNLWNGEQLCLNVDTANSADATYPPQTTTAYGATSVYNATPSQDHATSAEASITYQTTDTEPSLLPYLESVSMMNPHRIDLPSGEFMVGVLKGMGLTMNSEGFITYE